MYDPKALEPLDSDDLAEMLALQREKAKHMLAGIVTMPIEDLLRLGDLELRAAMSGKHRQFVDTIR